MWFTSYSLIHFPQTNKYQNVTNHLTKLWIFGKSNNHASFATIFFQRF